MPLDAPASVNGSHRFHLAPHGETNHQEDHSHHHQRDPLHTSASHAD
ncbi:MAG TPA: hypothetical protein VL461_06680 [Dictyobacter sp.]|nr:hypothetical protein [Dictyobacter sp.]